MKHDDPTAPKSVTRTGIVLAYSAVSTGANLVGAVFTPFLAPVMLLPQDRAVYQGLEGSMGPWAPALGFVAFPFLLAVLIPMTLRAAEIVRFRRRGEAAPPGVEARFLDYPFILALMGFGGWVVTYLFHIAFAAALGSGYEALRFLRTIPLYLTIGGIVFVSTYYALDALNRHRYVPVLFPGGRLSHLPARRLSVRVRFILLFVAVGLNPLFIVGTSLVVAHLRLADAGLGGMAVLSVVIILTLLATGFGLSWALASAFSRPLAHMARAAARISEAEYGARVPVTTVDELGYLGEGMNGMAAGLAEREHMRETFGRVVDPRVRDLLLTGEVDGELREVTVLFLDVRGFTTLSEGKDPRQVVALLNRLFSRVTRRVEAHGGLVNKFIGDAVLAVFGAPLPLPDHPSHGVACARELLLEVEALARELQAEGQVPLRVGIGLHTGMVMAGRIGGEGRLEYTIIGDAVNVASRLESATKELDAPLAISAECRGRLPETEARDLVELRTLSVKGRGEPITVFGTRPSSRPSAP